MSLTIGIDFCDDYITAYNSEDRGMVSVPAVICREKKEDLWYVGESAYRMALSGKGVLTDKLLSLLKKGGTSTIARKAYTAEQLIARLFRTVLVQLLNGAALSDIDFLVITLHKAEKNEMDAVLRAAELAGIERQKLRIISHQEAFIHYTLSQEKELYYNMAGLFDLSGGTLSYYRMKILRGVSRNSVVAEGEDLEEAFRIGILKNESGSELGDRIMTEAARKMLGTDVYSSVFLTGKGFERTDWAKSFIEFICRKRRVLYENGLFAAGAAIYANRLFSGAELPYLILCDTRVQAEISLNVLVNERRSKLIMVSAGDPWYDTDTFAELLPRGQNYIDLDFEPVSRYQEKRSVRIGLDGFPERPDRCTRISVEISFLSAAELFLQITDLGFGEIYPAGGTRIEKTVSIF